MKWLAGGLLAFLFAASCFPGSYEEQSRYAVGDPPTRQHWLGTDDLGRDRLSRVLYGSRISLVLAPAAALVSLALAAGMGIAAGALGGAWDAVAMRVADIFLSLPWLFLFIIARGLMPLNTRPEISLILTFLLMGLVGWAPAARVIRSAVRQCRSADFVLQARAGGIPEERIWLSHFVSRFRGILLAQFLISIPGFILGEASLGLLGLGVAEPMPSWGNLLRELSSHPALNEYWVFTPIAVLVAAMISIQSLLPKQRETP